MRARLFLVAGCLGSTAIGLGLIAALSLLPSLNNVRAQRLEARFRARHGGKTLSELYPPRATNETAAALDRIGEKLHLGLSPEPKSAEAQKLDDFFRELRDLIGAKSCTFDGSLAPPSPELVRILDRVRPDLARVVDLLTTAPSPAWARDFTLGYSQEAARDLDLLLKLQKLLIFDARERLRSGDPNQVRRADEILEASWRLNQALAAQPPWNATRLMFGVASYQLCLLRSWPGAAWRTRLLALDLRGEARLAYEADAYFEWLRARDPKVPEVIRAACADRADRLLSALERLERADARTFDPRLFHDDFVRRRPSWPKWVFNAADEDFWSPWGHAVELDLAAELTVLGIEERKQLAGGRRRGFERRPSKIAEVEWAYWPVHEEGTGGGTLIELVAPLADPSPIALPLRLYVRRESDSGSRLPSPKR